MNLLTALVLASFVAAPRADDAKPESLDGEWKVVEAVKGGKVAQLDGFGPVIIKGDKLTIPENKRDMVATFALDPTAKPAAIDMKLEKGDKAVIKGIYKPEKDKLTLCVGLDGNRPKEFKSEEGGGTSLLVLERVKK